MNMFVVTLRKGALKKAGIVCACGALLVAAVGVNALCFRGEAAEETAAAPIQQIMSADDLLTFLRGYGVEGDMTTATVNTVTVPRKWDESFQAFHGVIEQSGLSLKKCKGKQVDKWSVLIPAQSTEASKTYAVVLVYKNEAHAAYLLQKPSGEVLPLLSAAQTGAALPLTDEELETGAAFGEGAQSIAEAAGTDASDVTLQAQAGQTADAPVETVKDDAVQQAQAALDAAQAAADAAVDNGAYPTE